MGFRNRIEFQLGFRVKVRARVSGKGKGWG